MQRQQHTYKLSCIPPQSQLLPAAPTPALLALLQAFTGDRACASLHFRLSPAAPSSACATRCCRPCRRAQEIEPGYCEPSYWIALTRINQGEVLPGIAAMRASLGCKYTAAEALQTLNRLYVMMHENNPGDPMPMLVSAWFGLVCSSSVSCARVAAGLGVQWCCLVLMLGNRR